MEKNISRGVFGNFSFKGKIYLALFAVSVLLLISSAISKYTSQSDQLQRLLHTSATSDVEVFQAQISSDAEGLSRALAGMTKIEALIQPWMAQDRPALLEAVKPIFAELKAKHNITHTYFISNDGVVFLRAHNPPQFGDEVKRHSFLLAKERQALGWSLDMGKNFFSLRAVVPVIHNGQRIGYMEAAEEIDHLFGRTKKITGFEPTVLIRKDYQQQLGTTIKGASVGEYNILNSTDGQNAVELVKTLGLSDGQTMTKSGIVGDYFVSATPLKDGSDHTAGLLVFHRNISDMRAHMWSQTVRGIFFQGLLIVLGLALVVMVLRSALRTLGGDPNYARDITRIIANGDLQQEIVTEKGDETSLLAAMKSMRDQLRTAVSGIQDVSLKIGAASQEIAQGNASLSQRTEEQASSLEETASSMEEMTGTVKQNADSAAQARQLADANRQRAASGAEVVNRTVEAMGEINSSSTRIADIIGTIDAIAFQTNLLALNAAVEAARAGEQGRGFAVVASEVRSLAQRSAEAAKEIKGLIEDSVSKVKAGTKLVDESGVVLEEIIGGTQKVADIIAEIAAASQEQASGIDQVNNAIAQMDNMTQDNAALVEEAAAASRSMQEQAHQLTNLMSYFRVDSTSRLYADARISEIGLDNRSTGIRVPSSRNLKVGASRAGQEARKQGEANDWEHF